MNVASIDGLRAGTYLQSAQERVVHGLPAADVVRAEAERLQARRVFVTSSASLARMSHGPLQRVQAALGERLAGSFTGFRAHSPRDDVIAAAGAARAAQADLLVAVGGGSVIDGTKATLLCLWHGVQSADELEAYRFPAGPATRPIQPPADAVRMLAVSTTLSASDFTAVAGVTDTATRAKQGFTHPWLAPRVAVLDPDCTVDTPLPLLLSTGMRSVDHAVEGWCSSRAHPMGESHARLGAQLLFEALPAIAGDPSNRAARAKAQLGMWQAMLGCSTGAGTGASHGIGYALGATFDVPHGHTSCVLLPAVLRFNAAVNGARQQALAAALGRPDDPLADIVAGLVRTLGLPGSLAELSVGPAHWPDIAARALVYEQVQVNPRPLTSADDVMQILHDAAGAAN
jgi:maleylacetate reductase